MTRVKKGQTVTQLDAERQARSLSRRTFSGDRKVVDRKSRHIEIATNAIFLRWRIGPWQWQCKHIRWFLQSLNKRSPGTQYRYFRYLRAVLKVMDRWVVWGPHLGGPWTSP